MTKTYNPAYHRPLAFPDTHEFRALFSMVSRDKRTIIPAHIDTGSVPRYGKEPGVPLGPYCRVDGKGDILSGTLYVRPAPKVVDHLTSWFIGDRERDSMTFHVIVWSAEEALVIAKNSLSLANEWLAVIDPKTIPYFGSPTA